MASISLCMIVKNEEELLPRCLDSIHDLVDEIVIVDTGSTDKTKEIAARYTDNIYDFEWVYDFAKARNFSFSKCTMDYIYVADADEFLDEENRRQFKLLKDNIYPEIEIVQMMYDTISNDTVLNIHREYRPKLYKRLREFTWIDPVHETVRLKPLVFDSDIVITHAPKTNHSKRDFSIFEKALIRDGGLSANVTYMYATELYKCGDKDDFDKAAMFFSEVNKCEDVAAKAFSSVILMKWHRISPDTAGIDFETYQAMTYSEELSKISEINYELGEYYFLGGDYLRACDFYHKAVYNSSPVLDIHACGDSALSRLVEANTIMLKFYEDPNEIVLSDENERNTLIESIKTVISKYQKALDEWRPPEEELV